ncbi:MAG: PAS domain S-box protein [Ignavibacteria bacterium]|nr:PAS domain S-box protein [Ignavibacteria bacterium]
MAKSKKGFWFLLFIFFLAFSTYSYSNGNQSLLNFGEINLFLLAFANLLIILLIVLVVILTAYNKNLKKLKASHNSLNAKTKYFELLLNNLPFGLVITDLEGKIISHNSLFLKLLDCNENDSFVNKNLKDLIRLSAPESDFEITPSYFDKTKILTKEIRISTSLKNKWLFHILSSFENLVDETNTYVHIFSDITEKKQIEVLSKISEEKYKTFIQLSTDAMWCFESHKPLPISLSPEEQIVEIFNHAFLSDCNLSFARFYNFETRESAIGTPLSRIVSKDNPTKIALLHNFIINNYRLENFITIVQDNEGNDIFLRNTLFGIVENGHLVRAWGSFQNITELIKLQKVYEQTANKYQFLLNNLNSIVLHWDLNGRILFMNEYGLRFFGYSADELIGKNVVGTIVPEEESITKRNLVELMQEILSDPNRFEWNENENINKEGKRFWISWKNTPIKDDEGKITALLSVGIDVTKRKQAELEVQRTWDLIFSLMDILPDGFQFKDSESRWIHANQKIIEFFQLEGINYKGKTNSELISNNEKIKELFLRCEAADELTWQKGSVSEFEEEITTQSGNRKYFKIIKAPLFNEDGSKRGLAVITRDITLQKELNETLKRNEEMFRNIVEVLPLPALIISNNLVVYSNNAAKKIFFIDGEGVESETSIETIFKSNEIEKLYDIVNSYEEFEKTTITIQTKDGERIYKVSGVTFPFGQALTKLIVFSDITDQQRYSEYLEKVQKELTFQKSELERINKALNDKNKELAELNATKDRFFQIIAHDLKNPIFGVKNLSEEFIRSFNELKAEEKRDFLFAINSSATKLADLLENLLLWARTQTRNFPYNPVELNLAFIVENSISIFSEIAKHKKIVIISKIHKEISVFADLACITTILRNLISNSLKFTNEGGIIRIFSKSIVENDKLFEQISIQDNGIGIPFEVQPKLLQLDFHYTAVGTFGEKGTGLGLIITKELVELNGGKLWFESTPKVGSTFHFTLPKVQK